MVWIAAGMADAQIRGKVVLKVHANWDRSLIGLIEGPVGL
jgi:hypothetical protein